MREMAGIVAVTGASGFIGRRVVEQLVAAGYDVRVLVRGIAEHGSAPFFGLGVQIVCGDLLDRESLRGFLIRGCTVINLVYLWNVGEVQNRECISNLLEMCHEAAVGRLIHCSTAAVAGRAAGDVLDESSKCQPVTEYGITKLAVEKDILAFSWTTTFDTVIVRPTAVFGIAGEPLKKLVADLSNGPRWKNYLKSFLFGYRKMNLVPLDTVVAALIFLVRYEKPLIRELFIVSDDDIAENNFKDVERILVRELCVSDYSTPRIALPPVVLGTILRVLGRNNVNPCCAFDGGKLRKLGFARPVNFSVALVEYAAWYCATDVSKSLSVK